MLWMQGKALTQFCGSTCPVDIGGKQGNLSQPIMVRPTAL